MNCSELIVRYLSAAKINHVFGYPGDPNVPFLEACRVADLQFVLATREGTAGFMAEAYGQITGRPGVCMSTLGPGSSSMVNAVANAYLDRSPMLAISGQIESKRVATFTHQVLDHTKLFGPITKWTATASTSTIPGILRKAIRTAMSERPGPVHVSVPADVANAEAAEDDVRLPPIVQISPHFEIIAHDGLTDPVKKIASARRPVILTGISASRAGAGKAIEALAEKIGCPIVVSPMAKGVVNETHPYFAGTLDMACNVFVWDFIKAADLLINIGFDAVELIKPWSVRSPVIHVDSTPNTDQIYEAEIEIIGDVTSSVRALTAAVPQSERWSEVAVREHRQNLRNQYLAGRVQGRLNPSDVVDAVLSASQDDAIATTDVGSHKLLVGQGWVAREPNGVLMTNGLSSMGYSLPAAITAKLIKQDKQVICFTGDGGLAMVQGELRLASQLRLGLTVVVFCDNSLNRIELKQMAKQNPSYGTRIAPTNIPKLAESMDCNGVGVASVSALERTLASRKADDDRPLVIAAEIDPAQYAAQF